MRLDEAILSLERVYLEFTPAMMANRLDPVLAFKCRLEKSHDEVIQCSTAIDRLVSSNAEHSDVGIKDHTKGACLLKRRHLLWLPRLANVFVYFESRSSRGSKCYHTSSRSSYSC